VNRLALLGLLAACDTQSFGGTSPAGFCAANHATDPGPGCTVPMASIAIDGDEAEWSSVPSIACTLSSCASGDVSQIRSLRTGDGRIAFLLDIQDAPVADGNHSYLISIGPLREPSYWIDIRVSRGLEPEVSLNFLRLTGLPVEHAYGPSGIELALPVAALPHKGGVNVFGALEVVDGSLEWVPQQVEYAFASACWDPRSPVCQPL
jgi:hypothetical protein